MLLLCLPLGGPVNATVVFIVRRSIAVDDTAVLTVSRFIAVAANVVLTVRRSIAVVPIGMCPGMARSIVLKSAALLGPHLPLLLLLETYIHREIFYEVRMVPKWCFTRLFHG